MKEIQTIEDIRILVDAFYGKIRQDELLGPVFQGVIRDNWHVHLDKMVRFWQTILLTEHTYSGSPFAPHAGLPVDTAHFDRWLALFRETVDEYFTGKLAEEAKWRAEKMAEMFQIKIEYFRSRSSHPLA